LKHAPETNLAVLLETALRTLRRRSLVFIISDFISAPGWEKPHGMLAQRHEVLAVRLYDPREIEMPDIGPVTFEDAETGAQLFIDTHDRKFRQRFIEAARRREYTLNQVLQRHGVDILPLSTEGDMVNEIFRFTTLRKRRKMSPASFARRNAGARPPSTAARAA
jgi:uncharacterized protein (DUF58 family)